MIKNYLVAYKPNDQYNRTPMIRLANKSYLTDVVGLVIGDRLAIEYLPSEIVIRKINNKNLCSNKN